jgi:hypothetical protein
LIVDRATVAALARELGRGWDTVTALALVELTPVVGTGRARLLDLVPDRSVAELATLARTRHQRPDDVLAYFTHRASNRPTQAINGRLETPRRNALGFRNLINYRIPSLLHCANLTL